MRKFDLDDGVLDPEYLRANPVEEHSYLAPILGGQGCRELQDDRFAGAGARRSDVANVPLCVLGDDRLCGVDDGQIERIGRLLRTDELDADCPCMRELRDDHAGYVPRYAHDLYVVVEHQNEPARSQRPFQVCRGSGFQLNHRVCRGSVGDQTDKTELNKPRRGLPSASRLLSFRLRLRFRRRLLLPCRLRSAAVRRTRRNGTGVWRDGLRPGDRCDRARWRLLKPGCLRLCSPAGAKRSRTHYEDCERERGEQNALQKPTLWTALLRLRAVLRDGPTRYPFGCHETPLYLRVRVRSAP